jgi:hypothetical protein
MTSRERFVRTLTGKPVDRVPFMKIFGGNNAVLPQWEEECPGIGETIDELLGFEGTYRGWNITPVNVWASQVGPAVVLEETEEKIIRRTGDGTVEMIQKGQDFAHYDIEWPVKSQADWDSYKAKHLQADDPARFPGNWSELVEEYRTREYPLQLSHGGVYGFARNRVGDEALAYLFYDDPALVHDMMDSYTDMTLAIWEKQVAEVQFDLIECWEDMAFRSGSLISPQTFREFMKPNYQRIAEFAAAHGIEVLLVDSDGYIEDLTGVMLEAGVTAMYPYEVQSGNDVARVRERFPEMGCVGGLNKQVMAQGREAIDAEMERARERIRLGRFIPGPDHFVLSDVSCAGYRYFMERLREVVMETEVGSG